MFPRVSGYKRWSDIKGVDIIELRLHVKLQVGYRSFKLHGHHHKTHTFFLFFMSIYSGKSTEFGKLTVVMRGNHKEISPIPLR